MKRLSKNFLAILAGDVGRRLLGFAALAYLTRRISIGDFGAVNVGLTLLSYGLMASSGGLGSFAAREIARNDDAEFVGKILGSRLINAILVYVLLFIVSWFFIMNRTTAILAILFSFSLLVNAFFLDWYFQGKESMLVIGFSRLAAAVVYIGAIIGFVRSAGDIIWVPVAAIASDLIVAFILFLMYKHVNPGRTLRIRIEGWKGMMRQALPIGAGSLFGHFSINLAPIVIGIVLSNSEVGIYSAASKLVFFLLILDRVFATLLLPASARLYSNSTENLALTLEIALKWVILLALPLSVGGTLLADRLVPAIYGAPYVVAANCFRILIWYFLATMVHTIYSTGLVAIGEEKAFGSVMAVSAVFYAVTIVTGTIFFGVIGAAIGIVGSEILTVFMMRRRFSKFVRVRFPRTIPRTILAAGLMGALVFVLARLNLIVVVGAGAIIYAVAVYLMRGVTTSDIIEIRKRV